MTKRPFLLVLLAAHLVLGLHFLDALEWPELKREENPRNLRIMLGPGVDSTDDFSGLSPGSKVLRVHEGLPMALGFMSIFDYQRLFYGVGYEVNSEDWEHTLYDGKNRSRVSHYSVMPQRGDLQSPRVFDVRAILPETEISLVTWRNNSVPFGQLDLRLIFGDVAQDRGFSGIETLNVSIAGVTQFVLSPGVLLETPEGLGERRQGEVEVLSIGPVPLGQESRLAVRGTVNVPLGRSVLRLGVVDFEGNENTLTFVLLGTEGVLR